MNEHIDFDVSQINPETEKKIKKLLAEDAAQLTRNEAYYEKMRKEHPRKFRNPTTYHQMFEDAKALGDKFFMEDQ